jgi:uncharacterized protein (TIGR02145 family)
MFASFFTIKNQIINKKNLEMSMKRLITSISIVLILTMSFSCQHDQQPEPNVKGEVLFSFSSIATKAKSMMKSSDIENAASIIISIKNSSGILVYNLEQLPLIKINGSFITRPISLLIGNYELTQFIVADAQGNALFVAPIQGSTNAYLVNSPLPIAFTIAKDVVTKIVPEVVDVENSTPEDFGYSTFSFTVVETFNFLVSVFVYNSQIENFELTTADLLVSSEGIVLFSNNLQAITNQVTIRDGYDNYILNITKEGYETYIDTLTNAELKLHFRNEDNGPLIVTLEEGCNCPTTVTDIDGNVYETVIIGTQCWMKENLKVTRYNNGDLIPTGLTIEEWSATYETKKGAYAIYPHESIDGLNSEAEVLAAYGALYNWYTVDDERGLCPTGWRVPSFNPNVDTTDWMIQSKYVRNTGESINELISCRQVNSPLGGECGTSIHPRWDSDSRYSNDIFGFSALPSGIRWGVDDALDYDRIGKTASFLSSTEQSEYQAWSRHMGSTAFSSNATKIIGQSVRCVKD